MMMVDPYLFPARGRKRNGDDVLTIDPGKLLIPTFSPQGDGNARLAKMAGGMCTAVDPYLFPARGRKQPQQGCQSGSLFIVDPYLFPARGRKRYQAASLWQVEFGCVDPYLFPARGRKPKAKDSTPSQVSESVDPYLFPARGRKLVVGML